MSTGRRKLSKPWTSCNAIAGSTILSWYVRSGWIGRAKKSRARGLQLLPQWLVGRVARILQNLIAIEPESCVRMYVWFRCRGMM